MIEQTTGGNDFVLDSDARDAQAEKIMRNFRRNVAKRIDAIGQQLERDLRAARNDRERRLAKMKAKIAADYLKLSVAVVDEDLAAMRQARR